MWNLYITEVYIGDEKPTIRNASGFRGRDTYRLFGKRGKRSGAAGGDVCRKCFHLGGRYGISSHTHAHIKGRLQKGGGEGNKGPEHYVLENYMQKL